MPIVKESESQLRDELLKLEQKWDRMDGSGQVTEQEEVARQIQEVRNKLLFYEAAHSMGNEKDSLKTRI